MPRAEFAQSRDPEQEVRNYSDHVRTLVIDYRESLESGDKARLYASQQSADVFIESTAFTRDVLLPFMVKIPDGADAQTSNNWDPTKKNIRELAVSELRAIYPDKVDFYSYLSSEWLTVFGHNIYIELLPSEVSPVDS